MEHTNRHITVEQLFDITPRVLGIPRRVKICADIYSAGIPQPHRNDIKNMFHSDLPIDTLHALLLEFWKILRNGSLKCFSVNDFDVNYDSQ